MLSGKGGASGTPPRCLISGSRDLRPVKCAAEHSHTSSTLDQLEFHAREHSCTGYVYMNELQVTSYKA